MDDDIDRLRLADALAGNPPYDPQCERIDVAVKALWLLYLRAKWDLLALAGLPRAEFEPLFATFELLIERRTLSSRDADNLVKFARRCRPQSAIRLLSGALWLIGKYRQRKLTYIGVKVRWQDERNPE